MRADDVERNDPARLASRVLDAREPELDRLDRDRVPRPDDTDPSRAQHPKRLDRHAVAAQRQRQQRRHPKRQQGRDQQHPRPHGRNILTSDSERDTAHGHWHDQHNSTDHVRIENTRNTVLPSSSQIQRQFLACIFSASLSPLVLHLQVRSRCSKPRFVHCCLLARHCSSTGNHHQTLSLAAEAGRCRDAQNCPADLGASSWMATGMQVAKHPAAARR